MNAKLKYNVQTFLLILHMLVLNKSQLNVKLALEKYKINLNVPFIKAIDRDLQYPKIHLSLKCKTPDAVHRAILNQPKIIWKSVNLF